MSEDTHDTGPAAGRTGRGGRNHPGPPLWLLAIISLLLFVGSQFVGSVTTIMTDAVDAIGLQIAVYYGLAALAVTVALRRDVFKSASNALFIGLLPLLGAGFMAYTLIENLTGDALDAQTKWIGVGALAIGLIPLVWYTVKKVPYFDRSARLASEAEVDALLGEAA